MPIEFIHTYMVHPGKGSEEELPISGNTVALDGKLFRLLNGIYSNDECDIDISFNQNQDGTQRNECRDRILEYLRGPTIPRGRQVAKRLQTVTTNRSGLGLLFLIAGIEGQHRKLVISRFPADSAILAEEDERNLSVEFLERVFMKSATAYKAVSYQDTSLTAGFWSGKATDKQINNRAVEISNYWIADFLDSDFRTTGAAGTRRLAVALRNAAKRTSEPSIKSEIAAVVTLAHSLAGRRISINSFTERFALSDAAVAAIINELPSGQLATENFQFDAVEFKEQVGYRSIELDTGGILTAASAQFDEVFTREIIDARNGTMRLSTEGRIIDEKLSKDHA